MCRPKPDFHKCFDQICRPLPYVLLYLTGFPQRVLTTYVAFMEKLQFHNAVAGALGRPHRRDAGIPQGCPLSTMFIAFLMRPWVQSMLTLGAMPRVPADELLVYALGEDHERVFREAYDATHDYLQHLGARMAHSKSYTFSTVRQTRRKLRQHLWRGVNATIKVVSNVRDLGSHLNVASGMFGTTINGRIIEAIETIKRIAHTPYDYAKKAMLIRTNAQGILWGRGRPCL